MIVKGVILDFASLAADDLDISGLESTLRNWEFYPCTSPEETLSRICDADVVLTNKVILDRSHFKACPRLRLVVIMATGTNNVDLAAARDFGVPVCNVAGYSTPSVVQYTFAALLALRNRMPEYLGAVRAGRWQESRFFSLLEYPIEEIQGSVLGIVGMGAIGQAVASVAQAFGMQVLVAESLCGRVSDGRLPLPELLPRVDVLSLHCPLTPDTRNVIAAGELALMKPSAILINTARGGVVNERDLAEALRDKRIAGAAVDVLTEEPPSPDHPLLAGDIPNLLLTPHIGWASRQARQRLVYQVSAIIAAFAKGEPVLSVNGV